MHKGVILLIQASNREEVASKSKTFLEEYGNDKVWDWYVVGGRWTGILNPKYAEFDKMAREIVPAKNGFISTQDVEDNQVELQQKWEGLGQDGPNPWANHYKLPNNGGLYDIMPLNERPAVVKDWQQDPKIDGEKQEQEAKDRWGVDSEKPDLNMYGYSLKIAAHIYQQDFSFECNVFNTESYSFAVPDETDGWWAIIIDMHT